MLKKTHFSRRLKFWILGECLQQNSVSRGIRWFFLMIMKFLFCNIRQAIALVGKYGNLVGTRHFSTILTIYIWYWYWHWYCHLKRQNKWHTTQDMSWLISLLLVNACEHVKISETWKPQFVTIILDLTIKSDTGQHLQFLRCLSD